MPRELLMVAVVSALLGATAVAAATRSDRSAYPRWLSQAVMGLLCGAAGALVAIGPYVDLVPDRYEVLIGSVVVSLTVALVTLVAVRWHAQDRHQAAHGFDATVDGRAGARSRHACRPRRVARHRPVRDGGRHQRGDRG